MRHQTLFLPFTALLCPIFMSPDSGASGGSGKTDLEKLQDATAKITALETDKVNLFAEIAIAKTTISTASGQLAVANSENLRLTGELGNANTNLASVSKERDTLQGQSKTVEQKAQEIAAANGALGTPKGTEGVQSSGGNDGKAHFDRYQALMAEGKGAEATAYIGQHEKAINAYAASAK